MFIYSNRKKYTVITTCTIIVIAIIGFITIKQNTNKDNYNNANTITIHAAWVKSIWASLFLVADKMWYFKDENINMEISWMAWGDQVFKALTSKSTDVWFVGLVPYGFVGQQFSSIKLISVIADMNDNKIIMKGKNQSTWDILGKKIGYSKSTASDIWLEQFFEKNNINKNDVKLINLWPAGLATALSKGEIDWYSAREPNIYNGAKLMSWNTTTFDKENQKYEWYFSLFVNQSYIDLHKDTINHIKNALHKAQDYIQKNPNEAKALVSDYLKIDMNTLNNIWGDYTFHQSIENKHIDALKDIFMRANQQKWITTWAMSDISIFIAK